MLIDLMSQYNYLQVNIKLANLLGLNTATYWAELLNIYARVIAKKFEETVQNEGYFELDRDYITRRTTLSEADQQLCDKVLVSLNIMGKSPDDPNSIRLDLQVMESILTQDDPVALEKILKTAKIKSTDKKESKKFMIKKTLKDSIVETDADLLVAYYNWVDTIYDSGNYLSKPMVEAFIRTVREFSTNKDVQLKVIEIAMIQCYKNATWAINAFKRDYKSDATFISAGAAAKKNTGIDPNSAF